MDWTFTRDYRFSWNCNSHHRYEALLEEEQKNTRKTRILIVEISGKNAGLIVDEVNSIVPLQSEQLVDLDSIITEKHSAILAGVARIEKNLHLVLDVEQMIKEEERKLFHDICLSLKNKTSHFSSEKSKKIVIEKIMKYFEEDCNFGNNFSVHSCIFSKNFVYSQTSYTTL